MRKHIFCARVPYNPLNNMSVKYRPFPDDMYNQAIIDASATNTDSEFSNPVYRKKNNRVIVTAVHKPSDSDLYTWVGM